MNHMTITNYKPYQKGSLSAFFSVTLPSGLIVHECKLFQKESNRWIGLPSRAFTGKDGGTAYAPIIEFSTRHAADEFRETVLTEIDEMAVTQKPATPATRPAAAATVLPTARTNGGVPRAQIPTGWENV